MARDGTVEPCDRKGRDVWAGRKDVRGAWNKRRDKVTNVNPKEEALTGWGTTN